MMGDRADSRTRLAVSGGNVAAHPIGDALAGMIRGRAAAAAKDPGRANVPRCWS